MKNWNGKRIVIMMLAIFVSGLMLTGVTFALSKYNGKKQQCLNASGGRSDIKAVQQACEWASNGNTYNGCALWLGTASTHGMSVIYAQDTSAVVPAAFWGMCTDYADETRSIRVTNDNDSIEDTDSAGKSMNLIRGTWGAPTAQSTKLNVAKFISGSGVSRTVTQCYTQYRRTVRIYRTNGETGHTDYTEETIAVRIPTGNSACTTETNLCKLWNNGYTASSSTTSDSGSTSIIVKARNTEARFGGAGSGAWSHGTSEIVYAMPTDNIQWHSCYYPGVQKTVDTQVSDINGTFTNGGTGGDQYITLPTNSCMAYKPQVGYTMLRPGYDGIFGFGAWQNQYQVGKGITDTGLLSFPIGSSTIRESSGNREMGKGAGSDVGNRLEQKATTGVPISASVSSNTPSAEYWDWTYDGPCYTSAEIAAIRLTNPTFTDPHNCRQWSKICTNIYENPIRSARVDDGPASDAAYVVVPYNFVNDTAVEVPKQDVYAGETSVKVSKVTATVGTKYNGVTVADYATVVPKSQIRLFMYVSSSSDGGGGGMVGNSGDGCNIIENKQCVMVDSDNNFGALNEYGELDGGSPKTWFDSEHARYYNAFDAAAGDYLCFISALWPYSSGADDSTSSNGDGLWKYSKPACNIIAKRPSFQVWGGSLYSVGEISTSIAQKKNIYKDYISDIDSRFKKNGGTVIKFGPWVEQSLVIRDGTTSTVSSGAGAGLSTTVAGAGTTSELCNGRANLSFANYSAISGGPCNPAGTVGKSGIDSGISDREQLIDYWLGTDGGAVNTNGGSYNLGTNNVGSEVKTATGVTVRYLNSSSDLDLYTTPSARIGQGVTYLIKADGNVNITGDIIYNSTGYGAFGSIPKVVIYAKNVNIRCGVNEVDAIIITKTDGTVNTCSEFTDNTSAVDDVRRSRQLKIFGMVITDKIILGRTYGTAANAGDMKDPSGMPSDGAAAEIFDYDSSILIWSEYMAGSAETDTLQTVYQHELAPRY